MLVLRFWADLSVEQVAEVLDCPTGTVKSQTARGLADLRAILGDALGDLGRSGPSAVTMRHRGWVMNEVRVVCAHMLDGPEPPLRDADQVLAIARRSKRRHGYRVATALGGTVAAVVLGGRRRVGPGLVTRPAGQRPGAGGPRPGLARPADGPADDGSRTVRLRGRA